MKRTLHCYNGRLGNDGELAILSSACFSACWISSWLRRQTSFPSTSVPARFCSPSIRRSNLSPKNGIISVATFATEKGGFDESFDDVKRSPDRTPWREVARTSSSPQAVTRSNHGIGSRVTLIAKPWDVMRWRICMPMEANCRMASVGVYRSGGAVRTFSCSPINTPT